MQERIRLSEASAEVTSALAALDGAKLFALTQRFTEIAATSAGRLEVEPERVEAVERELRILGEVLRATEDNIYVLRRLQERKAKQQWAV